MTRIAIGSMKGGVGATTLSVNLAVMLQRAGHGVALVDCELAAPIVGWMERRKAAGLGTIDHRQASENDSFEDAGHPFTIVDVGTSARSTQALLGRADIWVAPTPPTPLEVEATLKLFRRWQDARSIARRPGLFAAVLTRVGQDERDLERSARRKLFRGHQDLVVLNQSLNRHPAWDTTYNGYGLHELPGPEATRAGSELHSMSVGLLSFALRSAGAAPPGLITDRPERQRILQPS